MTTLRLKFVHKYLMNYFYNVLGRFIVYNYYYSTITYTTAINY